MNCEFVNNFEEFLNKDIGEDEKKKTSFPISNDENNSNQNEYNKEIYEQFKFEIGTQTNTQYEDDTNNNENSFIRYTIKNSKKGINNKNNEEKEEFKKEEEKGMQTFNNNEEENEEGQNEKKENEDKIKNDEIKQNNINSISYNKNNDAEKKSEKNKLGRKTKRSGELGKHNKYSLDNMIRKVKSRFIDSAFNYINKQFKNKQLILLKIIGNQGKEVNRNKNIIWLQKTMKDVFYEDITKKTYNSNKNYNREIIDKIYFENEEKKVIDLLNLSIVEFLGLYCSEKKIDGMWQLDDVINKMKSQGEEEKYLNIFKMVSLKFVSTIKNLKSRERKIK